MSELGRAHVPGEIHATIVRANGDRVPLGKVSDTDTKALDKRIRRENARYYRTGARVPAGPGVRLWDRIIHHVRRH